jgi:deoxyribodipyrimidine photo-lyase
MTRGHRTKRRTGGAIVSRATARAALPPRAGKAGAGIVWFRQDLRLDDNPALRAAVKRGGPVLPVFIWAPEEEGRWPPGAASRLWLHDSLVSVNASLQQRGSELVIRRGPTLESLRSIIDRTRAATVYWNRRYEPAAAQRDAMIETALSAAGIECVTCNGNLLVEPWDIRTGTGAPYQVFTRYWRTWLRAAASPPPRPPPRRLPAPARRVASLAIADLALEPSRDWSRGIRAAWTPGERGGSAALKRFLRGRLNSYADDRDRMDLEATSRLSPHLHFGEISPGRVWHGVSDAAARAGGRLDRAAEKFLSELAWREFAHHLLHHFPWTTEAPLRESFREFPWRRDRAGLRAWQRGETGFPIVDAAMRQLWTTGWMHNRARMIVASFLVKDLLLPWQAGARWFWDTLVDADLASNTLGWQWCAGCGADAAPYFRIFNPVIQGRRFDPGGDYVRRWVPERAGVPRRSLHNPVATDGDGHSTSAVQLGRGYPAPIVNHAQARVRALEAFRSLRRRSAAPSRATLQR